MMKCSLCNREADWFNVIDGKLVQVEKGEDGFTESYSPLSWEYVDMAEYKARKDDGRSRYIPDVCDDCHKQRTGTMPPTLQELERKRKAKEK
jgi:hypothetical protein